ncbi:acetoacetyl-CoA synthetase [Paraburkholderia sp. GAS42]
MFDTMPHHSIATTRVPFYRSMPGQIAASQMTAFTAALQLHTGKVFTDYEALHAFSVHEYRTFWRYFVEWSQDLAWSGSTEPVCIGDECERARFFPHVQLNYADNLLGLSVAPADSPALTACHANGRRVRLTRGELRDRVTRLAHALSTWGLREGDRVVCVMRSDADAIVTALAVTALGATLSTAAPEMGAEALIDRFAPLAPRLLFAHTAPQRFDANPVATNIADLAAVLPSLQGIVCLDDGELPDSVTQPVLSLHELIEGGEAARFVWQRFPFEHPLFIMFSSGTTGKPKCIVHSAGGALLEHLKEHRLHSDLRPGDRMYFHTNCAWMMWNWQLSALASGIEIVTYDGPILAVDTLWRLVADERVTVFGTSPAYLKMCEDAGLSPGKQFDLDALRTVMSSGAVLYDSQFDWVRDHVKPLPVQSISGGTDILGCFVLGNPSLPVYAGEAQCKSLGLDVQAWRDGARTSGIGQLVCTRPFPSRPLGFLGDADGTAFHAAYFAANAGVWTHGDLIGFSPEGSARLHGRSDGMLNVRGINVGPGEIYRVLNGTPEIREAIVVEQRSSHALAQRSPSGSIDPAMIVLLLVLRDGVTLTAELTARVRRELAQRASAAHVPDRIIAVSELPVTHNGKLSEAAARNAVNGVPVGNASALRNPACLDAIRKQTAPNPATRELPPAGASREELERYLQSLWGNLFDFSPIRSDDNFFELGGNSLLAARLLADVRHSTGRAIPLATMLIAPTITRLATVIESGTLPASSPMLVPVRAGVGTPLFLVHGVSGTVMECWALAGALHSARPVYGLQARGLDGDQQPQRRVEDIAASYIEQIRTVQPSGPYAVTGYSFGGLIAFEIAQQLQRAGEEIELLCLLDTYVHEDCLPWRARIRHQWSYVSDHWRKLRAVPVTQLPGYLRERALGAADLIRMRVGRLAHRPDSHNASMPPVLQRVRETMRVAMTIYRPRPYHAGPIVYVRAAVGQNGRGDPLPLWRRVARAGLEVVEVSGDHNGMIAEPNVHVVAAVLDRGLAAL